MDSTANKPGFLDMVNTEMVIHAAVIVLVVLVAYHFLFQR